jgi:Protein of unknown function (DUF2924)
MPSEIGCASILAAPAEADSKAEIARLRDLDLNTIRARWRTAFRRPAPLHLSRHLLFRTLAYRLQADAFGDLDKESVEILNRISAGADSDAREAVQRFKQADSRLRPGTILTREWNGHLHRVVVLAKGFSWEGKTYRSLSAVASAIAGSKWNGPRFFGLRQVSEPRGRL